MLAACRCHGRSEHVSTLPVVQSRLLRSAPAHAECWLGHICGEGSRRFPPEDTCHFLDAMPAASSASWTAKWAGPIGLRLCPEQLCWRRMGGKLDPEECLHLAASPGLPGSTACECTLEVQWRLARRRPSGTRVLSCGELGSLHLSSNGHQHVLA